MFKRYGMDEASEDIIKRFVSEYRKQFLKDGEKVEEVERLGRRL